MYEFHGWISSLEQPNDGQIGMIAALKKESFIVESGYSNGSFLACMHGCSNHDRNSDELIELFQAFENKDARGCLNIFDGESQEVRRSFAMVAGRLMPIALPKEFQEDFN